MKKDGSGPLSEHATALAIAYEMLDHMAIDGGGDLLQW